MKKFTIEANKYLDRDILGFYNCEYVGYHKSGNPDLLTTYVKLRKMQLVVKILF